MTTSSRSRTTSRLGRWSGLLLIAALLPLLGPAAAPAFAADCTSEVAPTMDPFPIPTGPGCDDPEPPETALESVDPPPNAQGWIRESSVTFTFSGTYSDADTDPIAYECQFFKETAPEDWTACTSPATYGSEAEPLEETSTTPYTFRVRAVDTADNGIDLTADPFFPQDTDQPDFDQTPAERTVRVDTKNPSTSIYEGPYDSEGTGWPIVNEPKVTYRLDSNEADVTYRCQLDGKTVGCSEGLVTLKGLSGGSRTFSVAATDQAGNTEQSAETAQFVVPYNLTKSKNWSRKKAKGYFARDFLQTKRFGAVLKFRARAVTDILLLAPSGPTLGKIQVRVGNYRWKTINLASQKVSKQRRYVIRDEKSLFSGPVRIQCLSRGKQVRVDALVFPPT